MFAILELDYATNKVLTYLHLATAGHEEELILFHSTAPFPFEDQLLLSSENLCEIRRRQRSQQLLQELLLFREIRFGR